MRHDPHYESDENPSSVLVERYRRAIESDDSMVSLAVVHYRGTHVEYDLGRRYIASADSWDRATGAEVLAQLGWGDQTFREESIDALIPLLNDQEDEVVYSAAVALGHRRADRAVPRLLELAAHANPRVREGVTHGLLGLEDARAVQGLIRLSSDEDRDIRNWATFGLGSMIETDSPDIRRCLKDRLSDPDHEVRGEALVGLATRGEPSVVDALRTEWRGDTISLLSLEAASETGDARLLPHLMEFRDTLDTSEDPCFARALAEAMVACTPRTEQGLEEKPF